MYGVEQGTDCTRDQGTQTSPELRSIGVQTLSEPFQDCESAGLTSTTEKLLEIVQEVGLVHDLSVRQLVSQSKMTFNFIGPPLRVHGSACSWPMHYSVLMFLLNGYLWTDYECLSRTLGLPSCSHAHWRRIIKKLEPYVTGMAERSCGQVREVV